MQSIDEGVFADINGVPQWLTLRGADLANPALLIVGGPGFGYAALAPFFAEWEQAFTLVQWDQPGAGFTFARSNVEVASLAELVHDGLEPSHDVGGLHRMGPGSNVEIEVGRWQPQVGE